MASIKIEGLDELKKKLKENVTLNDVKRVVRHNGSQMQEKMVDNAEFTQGYQTGTTKRTIKGKPEDGGFSYTAGATTEYSPYLEWGTRYMQQQPFIKPAYEAQAIKFKKDMDKLVR